MSGRIESVERTYLSLRDPSQFNARETHPTRAAQLRQLGANAIDEWRTLYERVGSPWSWHDRDAWTDEQLADYLAQPTVHAYAVSVPPLEHAGLLELCRHNDGSVEIVYLGLVSEVFGHGLGAWLLAEAVRLAWNGGASRVWLHTCTLDGPGALPNYLARGFTIDRTETYKVMR